MDQAKFDFLNIIFIGGHFPVGSDSFLNFIITFQVLQLEKYAVFLWMPSVNKANSHHTLSALISSGVEIEGLWYLTAGVPAHTSPVDYNVFNP